MNLKELNVILADDDIDDCNFFKQALKELSTSVTLTIVHDGDDLMKYLSENSDHPPHIVFLDINMPRKNGTECLIEIRKNKKLAALSVVMFSTSNSWDTINELFKNGSNVYIHKPSDFSQLKQVIRHTLPIAAEKIFSNSPTKYILNASNSSSPKSK